MAITASDIKVYLSGGASNSDPNASTGGVMSTTQMVDGSLHNLFGKVSSAQATAGETRYRCIYIANEHGSLTWENVMTWISVNTPSPDTHVEIGLGAAAPGNPEAAIADDTTAPAAVVFSSPDGRVTGLSMGDMGVGAARAIWIKRIVNPGTASFNNDGCTLKFSGDTAE